MNDSTIELAPTGEASVTFPDGGVLDVLSNVFVGFDGWGQIQSLLVGLHALGVRRVENLRFERSLDGTVAITPGYLA